MANASAEPRRWRALAWLLAGLFVILQTLTVWDGGALGVFNSPDANANYHFAHHIYRQGSIAYHIPFAPSEAVNHLATRSSKVVGSSIVPVGFLGMVILYGFISKIVFINLIPYLTILFSLFGIIMMYRLTREVFKSERVAMVSALLMAVHPAWWYYTNDSLFPNVLFVSLLLGALFGAARLWSYPEKSIDYIWVGVLLVAALAVRTSEILWVAPLVVAYGIAARRKLHWPWVGASAIVTVVLAGTIWYAYTSELSSSVPIGYNVAAMSERSWIADLLLPFGFSPRLIARTVWFYGMQMFWPFTFMVLGGLIVLRRQLRQSSIMFYAISAVGISTVLAVVYGSWMVHDHPNPWAITISQSYVRYFLPAYVLTLPFAAGALWWLYDTVHARWRWLLGVGAVAGLTWFGYGLAFADSDDGIWAKTRVLRDYDAIATWIALNTPPNAIMVTDRTDKLIWPNRMVMQKPTTEAAYAAVREFKIRQDVPMYYVAPVLKPDDHLLINSEWRRRSGVVVNEPIYQYAGLAVYHIEYAQ